MIKVLVVDEKLNSESSPLPIKLPLNNEIKLTAVGYAWKGDETRLLKELGQYKCGFKRIRPDDFILSDEYDAFILHINNADFVPFVQLIRNNEPGKKIVAVSTAAVHHYDVKRSFEGWNNTDMTESILLCDIGIRGIDRYKIELNENRALYKLLVGEDSKYEANMKLIEFITPLKILLEGYDLARRLSCIDNDDSCIDNLSDLRRLQKEGVLRSPNELKSIIKKDRLIRPMTDLGVFYSENSLEENCIGNQYFFDPFLLVLYPNYPDLSSPVDLNSVPGLLEPENDSISLICKIIQSGGNVKILDDESLKKNSRREVKAWHYYSREEMDELITSAFNGCNISQKDT